MKHIPNILSVLRIPLALAFFQPNMTIRVFALLTAGATDWFDGFLSRKYQLHSRLGSILDPITDKFFVGCALFVFYTENKLTSIDLLCMLSRDIALALFGAFLFATKNRNRYSFQSIASGKAATALQFFVLCALILGKQVPTAIYITLALLGITSLIELFVLNRRKVPEA